MNIPINTIEQLQVTGKRVFLRADLNVPLKNGAIESDLRLRALKPTLDYLVKHRAHIILCTHIGRPEVHNEPYHYDAALSTQHLVSWLENNGYATVIETDFAKIADRSYAPHKKIILLENIRFYSGETNNDQHFAEQLAQTADIYIDDAFGCIHRNETSITLLAQLFAPTNRGIGKLVEHELNQLETLRTNPEQPLVLIIGGNKLEDKIPLLEAFIHKQHPHTIMIGGALAFPFIVRDHAEQCACLTCHSLSREEISKAASIMNLIRSFGIQLLLPVDHRTWAANESAIVTPTAEIPAECTAWDIGPKTELLFAQACKEAGTIFINGSMGRYEEEEYAHGTEAVFTAAANSNAITIVGGGNATDAAYQFKLEHLFSLVSTGGGATLTFLTSSAPFKELPALAALLPSR